MAEDIKTKSGLTQLYNEKVVQVERVQRPLGSSGGKGPFPHQGVRITTEGGHQYLVHKGSDFGKSSQTVVTDASHMSNKWSNPIETRGVTGHTVGDFVKTGGANYNLVTDNCIGAAGRMTGLGKK